MQLRLLCPNVAANGKDLLKQIRRLVKRVNEWDMRKNPDQHLETVRNIVVEILRTELNPSLYQQDLHLLHKSIPFLIYLLELTGIE